jgi:hypothetical protein
MWTIKIVRHKSGRQTKLARDNYIKTTQMRQKDGRMKENSVKSKKAGARIQKGHNVEHKRIGDSKRVSEI